MKLLYVKLLYVKFVCVKLLYVTFVCVKFLYVKLLYVKFCMVSVREAAGGGGGTRDTESKTRTPHKDVGKKNCLHVVQPCIFGFSVKRFFHSFDYRESE